jgi:hypothetical protein
LFDKPSDTKFTIWRSRSVSDASAFSVAPSRAAVGFFDAEFLQGEPPSIGHPPQVCTKISGRTFVGTTPYAPLATAKIAYSFADAARRTIRVCDPSVIADARTLTPDAIGIELSRSAISGHRFRIA